VALQAVEGGIPSGQQDAAPGRHLDLARDDVALGLVAGTEDRLEDHQLEVGQELPRHLFINYDE
jgi:hypothetical protein